MDRTRKEKCLRNFSMKTLLKYSLGREDCSVTEMSFTIRIREDGKCVESASGCFQWRLLMLGMLILRVITVHLVNVTLIFLTESCSTAWCRNGEGR
jgi:hypothetical protein